MSITEKVYVLIDDGQSNSTCASSDRSLCAQINKSPYTDNVFAIGPHSGYKIIPARNPLPHHTVFPDSVGYGMIVANELKKDLPPNSKIIIVCAAFAGAAFLPQRKEWMEGGKLVNHGTYSFDIDFLPGKVCPLNPTPTNGDINLTFDMIKMVKLVQQQYVNVEILGECWQQSESDIMNKNYEKQLLARIDYIRQSLGNIHLPISSGTPLKYWIDSAKDYGVQLSKLLVGLPDKISQRRNGYYPFMKIANFDDIKEFNRVDGMNVHYLCSSQVNIIGPRHAKNIRELRTLLKSEYEKYVASQTKKDIKTREDKALVIWHHPEDVVEMQSEWCLSHVEPPHDTFVPPPPPSFL
jgi:hypothetical protein